MRLSDGKEQQDKVVCGFTQRHFIRRSYLQKTTLASNDKILLPVYYVKGVG